MKLSAEPQISSSGCSSSSSSSGGGGGNSKHSLKKTSSLAPISTGSRSTHSSTSSSDPDDDQSPPISPLRSPLLSPSSSSTSSWGFSSGSQSGSQLSMFDDNDSNGSSSSQCNSKEDRATYNTKFARYHLETYRQNDRMRWNFDFDHNRPLDDSHHHHHQAVPRYHWEPAAL